MQYYLNITPKIIRHFAKDFIWSLPQETPSVFLTFDDGPVPVVTPKVLEILNSFNAKATFFCVGENVKKHPDIFHELKLNNHELGNHTYNHLNGWKTLRQAYISNVELAKNYIPSKLFRPPYGKITPLQSNSLKNDYKIIMWDILSGDFDPNVDAEKCANNVIDNAVNGSIIVFHDNIKHADTMLAALPIILDKLSSKGYQFKTISEGL